MNIMAKVTAILRGVGKGSSGTKQHSSPKR